jgi:hypothetical protein
MNVRLLLPVAVSLAAFGFVACGSSDNGADPPTTGRKGGSSGATSNAGTGGDGSGATTSGGAGGSTGINCKKHSACEAGEALVRACSLCVQQVCDVQPECCSEAWDANCVKSAARVPVCDCEAPAGGTGGTQSTGGAAGESGGSGPVACHDSCEVGGKLDASCGTCAASVCEIDDFCCTEEWDEFCIKTAASGTADGCTCTPAPDSCHSPCDEGAALNVECDPCVEAVCSTFGGCCLSGWDAYCTEAAKEVCSQCSGTGGAGGATTTKKCPNNVCVPGGSVTNKATCDACTESVCDQKPECCTKGWSNSCVNLAKADAKCSCNGAGGTGGAAGAGGTGGSAGKGGSAGTGGSAGSGGIGNACPVGVCYQDSAMVSADPTTCNTCVGSICSDHPECCTGTTWSKTCQGYALGPYKAICGCPDFSKCGHGPCTVGEQADPTCDPCVAALCVLDEACCKEVESFTEWDDLCIKHWDELIDADFDECKGYDRCTAPAK